MRQIALTKTTTAALSALLLSAGFITSSFAGPESLRDNSKDKMVQAVEQPICDPRWYISIAGGADFDSGRTDLNKAVFGESIAPFTNAFIQEHKWSDVYDHAWRIQGEIGYAWTEHLEVFGLFKYAHADATDRTRGSEVTTDFSFIGGPIFHFPISSEWDDYSSYGGELGLRCYFFPRKARIRPYFQVSGGITHVDRIGIRTFVDESAVGGPSDQEVYDGGFFNDSWVATVGGAVGVEVALTCHWSIGAQGGVQYDGVLDDNDRDLNTAGFNFGGPFNTTFRFANGVNNDSGDRLYFPVSGYVKFRF